MIRYRYLPTFGVTAFAVILSIVCFDKSMIGQEQQKKGASVYTDPEKADEDFAFQGEYVGDVGNGDASHKYGLQVIAMGNGKFKSVGYPGGLPGDGWNNAEENGEPNRNENEGVREGDEVTYEDELIVASIKDGVVTIAESSGNELGKLKRVHRKSSMEGKLPLENAIVLFDGTNADEWKNGQVVDDDLLKQGTTSKRTFGDHQIHIEFRLPYQPEDRGQARSNSGIYVQGRYEVQMLDSFGLTGENNECGGLYTLKKPDLNMCYPPLSWQTYDIDFTAAKYEGDKLVANPRITVIHNGVVIHDDVELPGDKNTRGAPVNAGPEKGPIYLQDHRNPVRYRNIWVFEKE